MPNKILLVDGYNVIHKLPETRSGLKISLECAREKLVLLISRWKASHPGFEGIIVFDSPDQGAVRINPKVGGIKCLFSASAHDADEEIIRFVRKNPRPADIVVVSDDNYVHNNCRAHGAMVHGSGYLRDIAPVYSKGRKEISRDGKGLDSRAKNNINAEMRKAWTSKEND